MTTKIHYKDNGKLELRWANCDTVRSLQVWMDLSSLRYKEDGGSNTNLSLIIGHWMWQHQYSGHAYS